MGWQVKRDFKYTNNHADSALQVLVKEKRRDSDTLRTRSTCTLDESDESETMSRC
jgi:hypothetical protein